ncbi:hypothetical protein [Marinobacterium rhizophilum]|uniref:hypothetical protein n=1 Tax=Marinobacterium rhizophilum TaxID=420402 RepID=UPI00039B5E31|nr:hypothetical protein [Marinobacterium rhizophilum]
MSNILYLHRFNRVQEVDSMEQWGPESWWVIRRQVSRDGTPLHASRVVHFACSETDARGWVERQKGLSAVTDPLRATG